MHFAGMGASRKYLNFSLIDSYEVLVPNWVLEDDNKN